MVQSEHVKDRAVAKTLRDALKAIFDAQRNGANLEPFYDDEIDELWAEAESALQAYDDHFGPWQP
jgi:hypothetical protein